jgi:catechol 2,3-dioxygenase-like lactoylglutathione lyase family enzyme
MSASGTPTPSPESAGLTAIGQIGITVTRIERAVEFYRDALGLKLLFQVPAPPMAFFDCGGVRLMLSASEAGETYSSVIYYRVPEIQQAFAALSRRGVPFEGEPHLVARMPGHELWMAFFRDPDRNLLALMCEVAA